MQRCRTVCAYAILNTFGAGALFSAVIASTVSSQRSASTFSRARLSCINLYIEQCGTFNEDHGLFTICTCSLK